MAGSDSSWERSHAKMLLMIEALGSSGWQWINEPAEWSAEDGLTVVAEPGSDLWQTTHYGYSYDTAHMFGRTLEGDLQVTATFSADYVAQYDQAGTILRLDAKNWIKAGAEYVDGGMHLSVVVTREFSDWSVVSLPAAPERVTIDMVRAGDGVTVRYGLDGAEPVTMLRLAYFPPAVPAFAGVMCAAPTGKGFTTRFHSVRFSS